MSLIDKATELGLEISDEIKMLDFAQKHGIREISIEFEGGGDDGAIEDIKYFAGDAESYDEWIEPDNVPLDELTEFKDQVKKYGFDVAYNYSEGDWIHNGGGQGYVKIDVATGRVSLEADYRVSQYSEDVVNVLPEEMFDSEE